LESRLKFIVEQNLVDAIAGVCRSKGGCDYFLELP
jgi:hypothetical protein